MPRTGHRRIPVLGGLVMFYFVACGDGSSGRSFFPGNGTGGVGHTGGSGGSPSGGSSGSAATTVGKACTSDYNCSSLPGGYCPLAGVCTTTCTKHSDCGCPSGMTTTQVEAGGCTAECVRLSSTDTTGYCFRVCATSSQCSGGEYCDSVDYICVPPASTGGSYGTGGRGTGGVYGTGGRGSGGVYGTGGRGSGGVYGSGGITGSGGKGSGGIYGSGGITGSGGRGSGGTGGGTGGIDGGSKDASPETGADRPDGNGIDGAFTDAPITSGDVAAIDGAAIDGTGIDGLAAASLAAPEPASIPDEQAAGVKLKRGSWSPEAMRARGKQSE